MSAGTVSGPEPPPVGSGPDARVVRRMFARVADRYDRANHLLSLGIDHRWRKAAVRAAGLTAGQRVLDVCCGTGDLALTFARAGGVVSGADFCPEMLRHAVAKSRRLGDGRPRFVAADALHLPFPDAAFDVASVAFGIRNVSDPVRALREMARVVRPGGRVVVLEFARPRVPLLREAYLLYFLRILPHLGRLITRDTGGAYRYLPESVMRFPERERFLELMAAAGLVALRQRVLSLGIACLYRGERPGP